MDLQLEHIRKTFGAVTALDDISFTATAPEFICLLGPSGCGKTTLLLPARQFERITSGEMRELNQIEQCRDARPDGVGRHAANAQAIADVVGDRHVGK